MNNSTHMTHTFSRVSFFGISPLSILNLLLLVGALGLAGCSRTPVSEPSLLDFMQSSTMSLTAKADAEAYRPGDAVILTVNLLVEEPVSGLMPMPDRESVKFYLRHKVGVEYGAMKVVEPVVSVMEKTGGAVQLVSGQPLQRPFVFTTLTFERGDYLMMAVYTYQSSVSAQDGGKAYAQPVFFSVQGQKVSVHRYQNGLVTEQEAIALALEHFGTPDGRGQALMVLDEKGFNQWWVNVYLEGESLRACFVNPYLGKVWKEAEPFLDDNVDREMPYPSDSRLIQELKEKRGR